ncbi:MAG: alkaline phosphatase family protein [Thermodesulfobacteriota bacterium]
MSKLIVIGIDGATPGLMFPWMADGRLPNFRKIMENGVTGELNSVPNQRSAAAWSSFVTGVNPGRHGIFEFYERVPLSHDIRFTKTSSRDGISFWKYLSDNNRTVIVVNVPMTYPAEKVNGCLISGLDAPGKNSPGFTFPPGLLDEIERENGPYIQEPGVISLVVNGQIQEAADKIIEAVRQRGKAVRYLMKKYDWDTTVAVFRETDPVQHCFWEYMEQPGSAFRDTVFNVYREIDQEVGKILDQAGNDCRVLVMSDHGFGFRQHGNGCLNQWLEEAGFLKFKQKGGGSLISKTMRFGYQTLEKLMSRRMKERLFSLVPGLISKVQSRVFFAAIDWEKTIAYGDNVMPVIWLNTADLSPTGVTENRYDDVIADLKTKLLENGVDVNSGRKVIEWVRDRRECYTGPRTGNAPDLLIRWKEDEPIAGLRYGRQGKPIYPQYPTREFIANNGDHRPMGVFMARGEGIRKNTTVTGLDIVDVTAAAVYLNDLPVPGFLEGKIRPEMFEETFFNHHPVEIANRDFSGVPADEMDYSADEETALKDRLRGLGYLE